MYDIIILGGGPAGSALASLAGALAGMRILLLEARNLAHPYEGKGRIKSCGGLLAPDAQRALAGLYGALPLDVLADPQIFAVRTIDLATGLERHYQRGYVNVRREAFDRWLFQRIHGVETLCGAFVRRIEKTERGWRVVLADGRRFEGRFLAGADGAGSVVRRMLFPPLSVRRYVSVQEVFAADAAAPVFAAVFDPEVTDYYAWGLPKDDAYLFGAALPEGAGAKQRFLRLKEKMKPFGFRLDAPLRSEATCLLRPLPTLPLPGADAAVLPGGRACLLGEAGGFISPSSAEGISYALNSAVALYKSLAAACGRGGRPDDAAFFPAVSRDYALRLWPLRLKLLSKNAKSLPLYQPFLRRLIMASGVGSVPVLSWGGGKRKD